MVRKHRQIAKVTLMEVAQIGVRIRARAALEIEATRSRSRKRRKVGEGEMMVSSTLEYGEESSFPLLASTERVSERSVCSGPSSNRTPACCCSTKISGELEEKIISFVELELKIIDFSELEAVSAEAKPSTHNYGAESFPTNSCCFNSFNST